MGMSEVILACAPRVSEYTVAVAGEVHGCWGGPVILVPLFTVRDLWIAFLTLEMKKNEVVCFIIPS